MFKDPTLLTSWIMKGTVDVERRELDRQMLGNIEKYEKDLMQPSDSTETERKSRGE